MTEEATENQDDEEGPIGKTDKDGSNVEEEDESLSEKGEDSQEPTSWKLLDIKSMKVSELRIELDARKLNSKGLKAQLVARLQEAVTKEQEEETKNQESEQKKDESNDDLAAEDNQMETADGIDKEGQDDVEEVSSGEHGKEEPEVMEVDRKKKSTEKKSTSDDDIFVKPAPAMDEKQKQALTAAYKLPGMLVLNY